MIMGGSPLSGRFWSTRLQASLRAAHAEAGGEDQQGQRGRQHAQLRDRQDAQPAAAIASAGRALSITQPTMIAPIVPPIWNIAVTFAAVEMSRPASFMSV